MNLLREHIVYLKDNPEGYWFKRKLYGFGWTPATRAGFGVTLLFLVVLLGVVLAYEWYPELVSETALITCLIAATLLFLLVVYKTGESPRWQWGPRKDGA